MKYHSSDIRNRHKRQERLDSAYRFLRRFGLLLLCAAAAAALLFSRSSP
jgi:hypothetical protein